MFISYNIRSLNVIVNIVKLMLERNYTTIILTSIYLWGGDISSAIMTIKRQSTRIYHLIGKILQYIHSGFVYHTLNMYNDIIFDA